MSLPESVIQAWSRREGPAVLTTVSQQGIPNTIWVGSLILHDTGSFLINDSAFAKTRANLKSGLENKSDPGKTVTLLWLTDDGKGYQVKGSFAYHTEGPMFEALKPHVDEAFREAMQAALELKVEEAYCGAEKLL